MKYCMVLATCAVCVAVASAQVGVRKSLGEDDVDAITIPRMLSYQGRLTDTLGVPVPPGNYQLTFRLYTQPTGGVAFWTEAQTVMVNSGLFAALLGSLTPIASVPDAGALYLGLQVAAGSELSPRLRLVSAAYAYKADSSAYAAAAAPVGTAGGGLAGTYPNPTVAQNGATTGQVLKWTGAAWQPRNDSTGTGDSAWVRGGGDSVLYTIRKLGIARGGADNMLHGNAALTHVNLGVQCTTGTSGQNYDYATVGGGRVNRARGSYSTVGGGQANAASGGNATVGGGSNNSASGIYSTVGGGVGNNADSNFAAVGGGRYNAASGVFSTIAGGGYNDAVGYGSAVAGGFENIAGGSYASIGGGESCHVNADYGFAVGYNSRVWSSYPNSAAFTGSSATASNQVRAQAFSTGTMVFTTDHPADPDRALLNQYAVGAEEMVLMYRGAAVIGSNGRVEVLLPDYFEAMNRNPMVQLTGVGTHEVVYVAEDVAGNRFVIGGEPGAKVYWTVTGERTDMQAEIARRLTPVEQPKTGDLAGMSADDDALVGTLEQLERMGHGGQFHFRTAGGRARYEQMRSMTGSDRRNR